MKNASRSFPRPRRSASAAQALQAEMERVKKMTIQERVEECLSLRHKHPWLAIPKNSKGYARVSKSMNQV